MQSNNRKENNGLGRTVEIWIAVLTILMLVSGIFAGFAAAYPLSGSMFYYENVSGSSGTYQYLNHLIVLDNTNVLDAFDEYPEGTYTNTSGTDSFLLKEVTALVTMYVVDESGNRISSAINSEVPQGSKVQFQITSTYPCEVGLKFTNPKGTVNGTSFLGTNDLSAESFGADRTKTITLDDDLSEGTWTVWAYFKTSDTPGYMVPHAPYDYRNGKSYTFTIVKAETPTPIVDSFEASVTSGSSPLTVGFGYNIMNMDYGNICLMCEDTLLAMTTYPSSKITYTFSIPGTYDVYIRAIDGSKEGISTPKRITVADGDLISTVYLKFAAPSVGATPATSSEVTGDGITCTNIEWATDPNFVNILSSGTKFAAKTKYYVKITLTNASNYHFGTTKPTVYINDINVNNYGNSVVELNGQTLTVIYKNFDPTSSDISSISANVTAPATGRAPSESATLGASTYKASSVKWYKDGSTTAMNTTDKFETNTKYKVTIVLEASGSNVFNSSLGIMNARINGNVPSEFKRDSNTKVTISYLFPATVTPTGPGITITMDPTNPKIASNANSVLVKYVYTITGDPTSSILDFGDGVQRDLGTQTSGSISHEYTMLGTYAATLTSTNVDATTSKMLTFSVTKESLIAKINASPESGTAPLKVTFKDASVGTVSSRIWDFGDGTTSTDALILHTYANPGTYTVTLTVSDGRSTSKAISAIIVERVVPSVVANFTLSSLSGAAPFTVTVTDTSSGTITSRIWDFGDGTQIMNKNTATHVYAMPGTYTVSLQVSDGSETDTIEQTVTALWKDGLYLWEGWNFISVPKKLSSAYDTAGELFSGVNTMNHAIVTYNTLNGTWEQVTASTIISPLQAYWIYSDSDMRIPCEFSTAPSTPARIKVYEGWNAVGISAEDALEAKVAFGNTDWYTYLKWNPETKSYATPVIRNGNGIYADSNKVPLWYGGWLFVNKEGNYIGFTS